MESEGKKRRLLDAGGPIEDDETVRQKMRDAPVSETASSISRNADSPGFDLSEIGKARFLYGKAVSPMGYFAQKGDLPMMRWLYVNGADTRDLDIPIWFPMRAALRRGHLEVCKWLYNHGAAMDVCRRTNVWRGNDDTTSPFYELLTFRSKGFPASQEDRDCAKWLILRGAFCREDGSGILDENKMRESLDNGPKMILEERTELMNWALGLVRTRASLLIFLGGTCAVRPRVDSPLRSPSPLELLGGTSGVLKMIDEYAGFVHGREARVIRQVAELLPAMKKALDDQYHESQMKIKRDYLDYQRRSRARRPVGIGIGRSHNL